MANPFTIEVVNPDEVKTFFVRIKNELKDFTPIWDDVVEEFWNIQTDHFGSEGHGKWRPLSPRYAAWKAIHYPGQPLLVLTGKLEAAATGITGHQIRKSSDRVQIGWRGLNYWKFHQEGTRKMPQRKVIDIRTQDVNRLAAVFGKGLKRRLDGNG